MVDIRKILHQYPEGRYDCPSCGGKYTFGVSKMLNTKVYQCFRAGCNLRGAEHSDASIADIRKYFLNKDNIPIRSVDKVDISYFVSPVRPSVMSMLEPYELSHIVHTEKGLWYDAKLDRLVFTLYKDGEIQGYIGKSIDRAVLPKWKKYNKDVFCYTRIGNMDTCVIVEDCLSAVKLPDTVSSIALLGTDIYSVVFNYIIELPFKKVIVALDKDAAKKSIVHRERLSPYFDEVTCHFLEHDIKDTPQGELNAVYSA